MEVFVKQTVLKRRVARHKAKPSTHIIDCVKTHQSTENTYKTPISSASHFTDTHTPLITDLNPPKQNSMSLQDFYQLTKPTDWYGQHLQTENTHRQILTIKDSINRQILTIKYFWWLVPKMTQIKHVSNGKDNETCRNSNLVFTESIGTQSGSRIPHYT